MSLSTTHSEFNQPPELENFNRYTLNRALQDAIKRHGADWAEDELIHCGDELGRAEWIHSGDLANRYPPELHRFDRFGEPLDEVEFHPAWHQCLDWIKCHGLAGANWADDRAGSHVRRAALFQLFAEVECGSLCPATMTYGAVPVLARVSGFDEPWLRLLTAPVYDRRFIPASGKSGLLMGMGLTERQGGSDVRANTTRAEPIGDGWYRLYGHKWFFSAAMCDAFLVTAQAPGGLSCFFLPRFLPDGERNGLTLVRAKDKLGDRSNASAEVEFDGTLVRLVGEEGRGLPQVLEMANYTRLDCANGSVGLMRAALSQALQYARHRQVFGKPLIDQPLMTSVLAELALELEAHTALCMKVAACIDAQGREPDAARLKRLLIPLAKYWVCKRTPTFIAEAMEATGGGGYVETGPMPRLYRQAPLNSIWEGSGNIMCLDVLRVLYREPDSLDVLFQMLEAVSGAAVGYDRALDTFRRDLTGNLPSEYGARRFCGQLALLCQAALLLGADATLGESFVRGWITDPGRGVHGEADMGPDATPYILDRSTP